MADTLAESLQQFAADAAEAAAILGYSLPPLSPRRLAWRRSRVRRALWLLASDVETFQIEYIGAPLLSLLRRVRVLPPIG